MLLRLLFCLTGSLLSGSAVAGLFTALVLHFLPDPTDHQKPSGVKLEAHQGVRWAEVPIVQWSDQRRSLRVSQSLPLPQRRTFALSLDNSRQH